MQYVMLIYENPQDFARRAEGDDHPYFGAGRAYRRTQPHHRSRAAGARSIAPSVSPRMLP